MNALKVTLKHVLSRTLRGAVNKQSIALWTLADDFVPLTLNQTLIGGTPGATVEHRGDLKEQYCGASKYQRKLLDMWWKQQEFASPLPYSHLKNDRQHANIQVGDVYMRNHDNMVYGTYRLSRVLRNVISASGQMRTVKLVYEEGHSLANRENKPAPWREIAVSVQRLVLLAPIDKVPLSWMTTR